MTSIFIASSPNTQSDDFFLALKHLVSPLSWYKKSYIETFEHNLKTKLGVKYVNLFDSSRSSLYLFLKSLNITSTDEVILPSFTCLVLANAVVWSGAKPIYLDTSKDDFNADFNNLEEKINKNTKAIIVQHTFGKIVDIQKIKEVLAKKNSKALIIEDWAHSLKENHSLLGDAAILTFGIEKIISGVRGGALVLNDSILNQRVVEISNKLPEFPIIKTFKAILNPIFWYLITPVHAIGFKQFSIGAIIRETWRALGFLGIMIEKEENLGLKPSWLPTKIAPVLANLANHQLNKINKLNSYRLKLAQIYSAYFNDFTDNSFDESRIYLRYPLIFKSEEVKNKVWNYAKNKNITLGDWYKAPLYAKYLTQQTYKNIKFDKNLTPETSRKTKLVLNLPTSVNIGADEATKLAVGIYQIIKNE